MIVLFAALLPFADIAAAALAVLRLPFSPFFFSLLGQCYYTTSHHNFSLIFLVERVRDGNVLKKKLGPINRLSCVSLLFSCEYQKPEVYGWSTR